MSTYKGTLERIGVLEGMLKEANEANANLMAEYQALIRNSAVERRELRAEIERLKAHALSITSEIGKIARGG